MPEVTARMQPIAKLPPTTGHVASVRMPIPLAAMEAMEQFITAAYGPGCTVKEEPQGWLKIETPEPEETADGTH